MIDKKILAQYKSLQKDIIDISERIDKDREHIKELECDTVTDSVSCGRKGKKPLRTVKITGYPSKDLHRCKIILQGRIIARERHKAEFIELESKIDEYINNIDDAKIRLIIKYKYFDDLEWNDVAIKLGINDTADSARKYLERYLEKTQ